MPDGGFQKYWVGFTLEGGNWVWADDNATPVPPLEEWHAQGNNKAGDCGLVMFSGLLNAKNCGNVGNFLCEYY